MVQVKVESKRPSWKRQVGVEAALDYQHKISPLTAKQFDPSEV